jgi:hypothetical protein
MLLRIEGRAERDDWRLRDIDAAITRSVSARMQGNDQEADAFKRIALATALTSPDLTVLDRRRVTTAILEELAEYEKLPRGARGLEGRRDLDQIVKRRGMPLGQAEAKGEMTFEELAALLH